MNIKQNPNRHNIKRALSKKCIKSLTSNKLPYRRSNKAFWEGSPKSKLDLIATVILTELVSLKYDVASSNEADFKLKNCFAHFGKRFKINKLQIQRASCRLHQAGIVTRLFREVIIEDQVYKELDLKLNTDELTDLMEVC
jgi:hypothetical protein